MSVAPVISMLIFLKGQIIFIMLASWKTQCLLFTLLSGPVVLTQGTLTRIQGHMETWLINQQHTTWQTRAESVFIHFWVPIITLVWYKLFNYCHIYLSVQEIICHSKNQVLNFMWFIFKNLDKKKFNSSILPNF